MTALFASPCQCANCPGGACTCGCRRAGPLHLQASAAACDCADACGCDAAESGCSCSGPVTAD